ncbi:LacI family DNA-binding transcriptional regulator [Kribbella sp. NPDC004536]|uniref:LacI family DNA-binding transcriptional regulator n=1 Tax=Kribbella sp. NPDC004536 TaxID=3364106 RepID=UPI003698C126
MKDVALRAGVTKQTVSNVVNKRPVVSPDTVARVEKAVAELGFRSNLLARGLATGQTMIVGLVVPTLTSAFYAEMVEQIENALDGEGYNLVVGTTYGDQDRTRRKLEGLRQRSIDGLLLADDGNVGGQLEIVRETGLPFVLCAWENEIPEDTTVVTFDYEKAGYLAGRQLRQLGHRQVGVVGDLPAHQRRLDGLRRGLGREPAAIVASRESSQRGGYNAAATLLAGAAEVTAIMATHDLLALGVLEAAKQHGRRVPDDLSLVSIDDIEASGQAHPPVTTVAFPIERLAQEATSRLLRAVGTGRRRSGVTTLPPKLVVRASTARSARR